MAECLGTKSSLARCYAILVVFMCFCTPPSNSIIAQAPSDCKRADTDQFHEFFDVSQLKCTKCSQDNGYQTVSSDGLRCVCKPGLRLTQNFGGAKITCEPCEKDKVTSSDGWGCVLCDDKNPINKVTNRCEACNSDASAVERLLNGQYNLNSQNQSTRSCTTCAAKTFPDNTGGRCVRCNQILSVLPSNQDCTCPSTQLSGGVCFQKATDLVADSSTLYMVKFESIDPVESSYFRDNIRAAHAMCNTPYLNLTACQCIGNMCVMRMYSKDTTTSNACGLYYRLGSGGVAATVLVNEWPPNMPWLYYSKKGNEVLTDRTITTKFTFPNMQIPIVATMYTVNGSYIGMQSVTGGLLQLCKNTKTVLDAAYVFGTNYEQSCTIPVKDLWDNEDYGLIFYDLYLRYTSGGVEQMHPVPVLLLNYRDSSNELVNRGSDRLKWELTRRFFLVDNLSGRPVTKDSSGDTTTEASTAKAKAVRYAKSVTFVISLQSPAENSDTTGLIYPPYLAIDYDEVKETDYDSGKSVDVSFKVEYTMDLGQYSSSLSIALGVMCALAALFSIMQTAGWSKRSGRINIEFSSILKFFLFACGAISNALFVVILGAAIWWFLFYKRQTVVFLLIPLSSQESSFVACLSISFALKCIEILHMFINQITIDIFLIDWERPRGRVVTSNDSKNKGQEAPVSIWRTYFVANEWNEIQTTRKINHVLQIFTVLLFLHVIGFENLASADPVSDFSYAANTYHAPPSRILRFAIGALAYLVIGAVQWIFYTFIYERFIEDKVRQYVDLCSMSNVSVFIMENQLFGYYIHGRSVHGCADTGMREMHANLKREEEDLCGQRGLLPNTDQQTFQMALPRKLRTQYDKVLMPLRVPATGGAASRVERGQAGGATVDSDTERKLQAYSVVNRFLQAFIDHSLRDLDYMVKDKMLFEGILGMEFQDSSEKGFFYNDNGHSFDSVLFYGNEGTLFLFEVLLFSIIDLMSQNFILAAVITFIADELLMRVRDEMGRKNLAKKTLVDERFLI